MEVLDTESQESHAEWSLPLRIASSVGHFGVLVPLAVLGVIVTWRERSRLWVLHAMLVAYAVSVVLFYVFARYRYPLVPLLILFAAAGLAHMWHRAFGAARRDRDRPRQGYRPSTMLTAPRATSRGGGPPKLHANAERAAPRSLTVAVVVASAIFSNWPLVSRDLNRSVTEHNLATALMSEGRSDEALAHYRRAVQISPGYAPAYNNMASVLRAQGHIREAEASYERALALRPDYSDAHYNLANALLDEGRTDEAVAHFEHALQSTGGAADVHNNLGIALAAKGRRDEAIAEFRQAVELDPESANAHRNLGDALASRGERDEAIDHLRRATQLAPADAAAHYDLGSTLLEAGRLDEAVAEFRAAIRLAPTAEAHNNLGIALGSQGKLDEAIAEFEAAVRIHPEFVDARRNLETARSAQKRR